MSSQLFAFKAESSSTVPIWGPLNLAGAVSGQYVNCSNFMNYYHCGGLFDTVGVTGTPTIDMQASPPTLYVAAAVDIPSCGASGCVYFYLFAVDITKGTIIGSVEVGGQVAGVAAPNGDVCANTTPQPGATISFNSTANNYIQRSALLEIHNSETGGSTVYVPFAAGDMQEQENGWLFSYPFSGGTTGTFSSPTVFATTPYGTGGGIWHAGGGPAWDGSYIYLATGNGSFEEYEPPGPPQPPTNAGDSLLKLDPSSLAIKDYYTPWDVFSAKNNKGRCAKDLDFDSGGVLLPTNFTYTGSSGGCSSGCSVVIDADKESYLYVANTASLGGFNSSFNSQGNIQTIQSVPPPGNDLTQGYWAGPAYMRYVNQGTTYYMLYYSVDAPLTVGMNGGPGTAGVAPTPINGYQLQPNGSSGPIPSSFLSTSTLFCGYAPTPSVSSNGTEYGTGIVWAIETNQNSDNTGTQQMPDCAGSQPKGKPAALHAFDASTLAEIYESRRVQTTIGHVHAFPTPTVFNSYVYFGTDKEVDVFGLCSNGVNGRCEP